MRDIDLTQSETPVQASPTGRLRILSWNLLRGTGADASDVAKLIVEHRPDLVLMQEAQSRLDDLPAMVGGQYIRCEMEWRSHGFAAWSPFPIKTKAVDLPLATRLDLPIPIFRLVARRMALSVRVGDFKVVTIHLDHGQAAVRRQIRHVAAVCPGVDAIVGDFNAFGPTNLPGFRDVGPRARTHVAYGLIPVRIDRCLARGLTCEAATALGYGPSDHRPILLDLRRQGVACLAPTDADVEGVRMDQFTGDADRDRPQPVTAP